jgi:Family of unknown function (DUF5906)
MFNLLTREVMSIATFRTLFAHRTFSDETRRTIDYWLDSPLRRQYKKLVYEPQTTDNAFNLFPGWGVKSKKGDIKPWVRLMDSIYGQGTPERRYAEQWDGYPIKYPGTKLNTARLVMSAAYGTGKTSETYALSRVYGEENAVQNLTQDELGSQFNPWADRKQLIVVQECLINRSNLLNRMKTLITHDSVTINRKNQPTYTIRTCANYIFQSNHPNAMRLPTGERRIHVHEMEGEGLKRDEAFWNEFYAWANSEEGPAALRYHFEHLDYEGFQPFAAAPLTAAKREMIEATSSAVELWCAQLKADPIAALGGDFELATTTDLLRKARKALNTPKISVSELRAALKCAGIRKAIPEKLDLESDTGELDIWGKPKKRKRIEQVKFEGQLHTFWVLKGDVTYTPAAIRERYQRIYPVRLMNINGKWTDTDQ